MELLVVHSVLTQLDRQLESKLRSVAEAASISLSYAVEKTEPLVHAVEISKLGATVTELHFNFGKSYNIGPLGDDDEEPSGSLIAMLSGLEQSVSSVYGHPQPLWSIYDVQRKPRVPVLSITARDLLKAMRVATSQQAGRSDVNHGLRDIAGAGFLVTPEDQTQLLYSTLLGIVASPGWCSVCGSRDDLEKCSGCGWETYCSPEHQREEWTHHKSWSVSLTLLGACSASADLSSTDTLLHSNRCKKNRKTAFSSTK